MIQFDQNAGLPMSDSCLQTYCNYSQIHNINGFSEYKMKLQADIETIYGDLQKSLGFDKVIFNHGATDSINNIFCIVPDIFVYPNQHKTVDELKGDPLTQNDDNICLICYVDPADSTIQSDQFSDAKKKFQSIVLDVSQAIGKIRTPTQSDGASCIFFSCHKLGGPFGTGFMAMSDQFYKKYFSDIHVGTFDVPGFMSASLSVREIKIPDRIGMYKTYLWAKKMLEQNPSIINIQPQIDKISGSIYDTTNAFSSITFELKDNICPRSFQKCLEDHEMIQIGFKSACQSDKTGVLRLSWRQPIEMGDIPRRFLRCIQENLKDLNKKSLSGGKKLQGSFLEYVNANKYWLTHHFVKSHDAEPMISEKYAIMFQPDLLRIDKSISLIIPPHAKVHFLEEEIQKKKDAEEDYDLEDGKIRIKRRRLSKYVWINNPDAIYQLNLTHFETESITINLSDQVFRSVGDGILMKKKFPQEFQAETKQYKIVRRSYPSDLLQQIDVKYIQDKEDSEKESSSSSVSEESSRMDENGVKTGGKKDSDEIRSSIRFYITNYNLDLLNSLGGNALSVAILTNLDKLYRRGEKPSRYHKPHQLMVQDLKYIDYQNCLGNILTSMKIMKEIDQTYPRLGDKFNKPESQFNGAIEQQFTTDVISDSVIIQQITNTDIQQIKAFLQSHNPPNCVIYLPNINTQEIEDKTVGLYNFFLTYGFKYEISDMEYYDVWENSYRRDIQIVKFYRTNYVEPEQEVNPEQKPELEPEPEIKPEPEQEQEVEAKPEPKPEAKPEPKPESKPEPQKEEVDDPDPNLESDADV